MRLSSSMDAKGPMSSRYFSVVVAATLAVACNKPLSTPPDASTQASDGGTQSALITSAGGTVSLPNGTSVSIPAGALSSPTTITISQDTGAPNAPSTTLVGTPVVLGPEGTQFSSPVTVTLAYDPTLLPSGASASQIAIFTSPVSSPSFTALPTTSPDSTHVQAQTTHFSIFEPAVASESTGDGGTVTTSDGGTVTSDGGTTTSDGGTVTTSDGGIVTESDGGTVTTSDGGVTTSDAGQAEADAGHVVADAGVNCYGDGGCWSCTPQTQPEFLNQCTGSQCSGFDNAARLQGLYPDGGLPPLP
jgi:hypothetical protein